MRIPGFSYIIKENSVTHTLKDGCVVIDAQNFLYKCYHDSKLPFKFGTECDRYAKYLEEYLGMFKRANITCYFIFKGGSKEFEKKIEKMKREYSTPQNSNEAYPYFINDIHLEILKKMKLNFYTSEFESKYDCITLARKLSCPVISDDIEFPLSGVQYINKESLKPDENKIQCELFSLDIFLSKRSLNKDKLSLFILLSDQNLFPQNSFDRFFRSINVPLAPTYRNKPLLEWLSKQSDKTLQNVFNQLNQLTEVDEEQLFNKLNEVKNIVNGEVNSQVASDYFFRKGEITDWFVMGVATNQIVRDYVGLHRFNVLLRFDDDIDVIGPALNIIKYAYDLLTEFKHDGLKFIYVCKNDGSRHETVIPTTITKPTCQSLIRARGLFQYFISEAIHFDCDKLLNVPSDARMLMITLIYVSYFKLHSKTTTEEMAYAVLLSYVMVGVVPEYVDGARGDSTMTRSDCESAAHLLQDYFDIKDCEQSADLDLLAPLEQLQRCLSEMNNLNKLCGSPLEPTIYSKTYNGTFIYRIIDTMQHGGIIFSITELLIASAPTVLAYFLNVVELYESHKEKGTKYCSIP